MKKISVFNHVSLDGFFSGPNNEIDWFNSLKKDIVWDEYTHSQAASGNTFLFGHKTYDLMKKNWSTSVNKENSDMGTVMGSSAKIVFSKKLNPPAEEENSTENLKILSEINSDEIIKLKEEEDMTILGSGSIVQQFAKHNLIDEYNLVVVPITLGNGKPLFKDFHKLNLDLLEARSFKNGIVLLRYQPVNNSKATSFQQETHKPDRQPYLE
ncbi:MAG: dihydrofolate reductase family protein [Bacteroidota bacterium]